MRCLNRLRTGCCCSHLGDQNEADSKIISRNEFYSSSRNTRDFNREIRAQSETRLHREYNLAMKNKSLSYTMLHWSIVTHA